MTIIGIDPGKSGGIAWIREGRLWVEKMPDTIKDLWELVQSIAFDGACKAYLEQVSAMPKQGVTSCFTFGNGFGHLEMALTAAGIPFERVRPQKWQKALGCSTGGDKNVSKRRAQELFPGTKFTHATADASLIAEFGRRNDLAHGPRD